jgi:hypothetical protein
VRGTLTDNGLSLVTRENGPRLDFQWRDANSGNVSQPAPEQRGGKTTHNGPSRDSTPNSGLSSATAIL